MSAVRVAEDLKQLWVSQDSARNLKVFQAPISLLYKVSAILLNLRTCAYRGGEVVGKFGVFPQRLKHVLILKPIPISSPTQQASR